MKQFFLKQLVMVCIGGVLVGLPFYFHCYISAVIGAMGWVVLQFLTFYTGEEEIKWLNSIWPIKQILAWQEKLVNQPSYRYHVFDLKDPSKTR